MPKAEAEETARIVDASGGLPRDALTPELGKSFLPLQHFPQGLLDLFVPQTIDERVQHGDHQRAEHGLWGPTELGLNPSPAT